VRRHMVIPFPQRSNMVEVGGGGGVYRRERRGSSRVTWIRIGGYACLIADLGITMGHRK